VADYDIPQELRYTREDEWVRLEGERVVLGVTDYAQQQLGDVVFVELPAVGATVERGEPFGVVESVKAVADLFGEPTIADSICDRLIHGAHRIELKGGSMREARATARRDGKTKT